MHHSNDTNDPFPGEGEGRPFFQCEMCGETVDDGPATETTDRLVHGRLYITDRGKLADIYVLAKNAAEAPITIATDVRIARAWQIVRAVNAHDSLVEAAMKVTDTIYHCDGRPAARHMADLRAALALARGVTK